MPTPLDGVPTLDSFLPGDAVRRLEFNENWEGLNAEVRAPFYLSSYTYDAGLDRLVFVVERGRWRFGPAAADLVEKVGQSTINQNVPGVNTSYYLYVKRDGTWVVNTTGAAVANAELLWRVATANPVATGTLVRTDMRGRLPSSSPTGRPLADKAGDYAMTPEDGIIRADASAALRTITLPDATLCPVGRPYTVKKWDAGTSYPVRIQTTGGQTIDAAAAPFDIEIPKASVDFYSDGTNWSVH